MIERFIAPVLTFAVLIAGHVAIAASLFSGPSQAAPEMVVKAPVMSLAIKRAC
jgi:hypothetical protein